MSEIKGKARFARMGTTGRSWVILTACETNPEFVGRQFLVDSKVSPSLEFEVVFNAVDRFARLDPLAEAKRRLASALESFRRAAFELDEAWPEGEPDWLPDVLVSRYPFSRDVSELVLRIGAWCDVTVDAIGVAHE